MAWAKYSYTANVATLGILTGYIMVCSKVIKNKTCLLQFELMQRNDF